MNSPSSLALLAVILGEHFSVEVNQSKFALCFFFGFHNLGMHTSKRPQTSSSALCMAYNGLWQASCHRISLVEKGNFTVCRKKLRCWFAGTGVINVINANPQPSPENGLLWTLPALTYSEPGSTSSEESHKQLGSNPAWNLTLALALKTPTNYETSQNPYKSYVGKVLQGNGVPFECNVCPKCMEGCLKEGREKCLPLNVHGERSKAH